MNDIKVIVGKNWCISNLCLYDAIKKKKKKSRVSIVIFLYILYVQCKILKCHNQFGPYIKDAWLGSFWHCLKL